MRVCVRACEGGAREGGSCWRRGGSGPVGGGVLPVWIGAWPRIGPRGRQEPQAGPEGGDGPDGLLPIKKGPRDPLLPLCTDRRPWGLLFLAPGHVGPDQGFDVALFIPRPV